MKQTAVEWLIEQTRTSEWHSLKRGDIIEQAKEMEKNQILDAFEEGSFDIMHSQEYYERTFTQSSE